MSSRASGWKFLVDVIVLAGASTSMYYLMSMLLAQSGKPFQSDSSKKKAKASLRRLQLANPEAPLVLDEYEELMLGNVVGPTEINVGFADIGGLDPIIDELRESVLYPLTEPDLYAGHSTLLKPPKGVLLYGPPGCGKTMLAKALASQSGANFINVKMSSIMDKWFGESNKIVAAIFSLAAKLEPAIIFIDEVDSFLRERSQMDHESMAMIKAEFMTLWDGLTSDSRVLVLAATNRPNEIDRAILRRMPKRFAVSLPKGPERRRILELLLKDTRLEKNFDWDFLIDQSAGLSGSDLKELCREAAMTAMREYIRTNFRDGRRISGHGNVIRPLKTTDFLAGTTSAPLMPNNVVPDVA